MAESSRPGRDGVHTSGRGGLPDLVSFSSKLARIGDIFSHQVGPDVWREMIEKESFEQETFILVHALWVSWSKEHILPINAEGFSLAAKVRDMNA